MNQDEVNRQAVRTLNLKRFRKQKLIGMLEEILDCSMGYNLPVLPFIIDQRRQFLPEKMDQFLDYLTDIPEITAASGSASKLRGFYKSMLYCSLRTLTTAYAFHEDGKLHQICSRPETTTFRDIRRRVRSREELLSDGIYKHPVDPLLALAMNSLYCLLSGKESPKTGPLTGILIRKEEAEYDFKAEHPKHNSGKEMLPEENGSQEMSNLEETARAFASSEMYRVEQSFASREDYCRHYENLLALFPDHYSEFTFNNHISRILERFLMEQDLTLFGFEDAYLNISAHLNEIVKQIKSQQEV